MSLAPGNTEKASSKLLPLHEGKGKRILIVSGAWEPQINGVARTLQNTKKTLESWGHTIEIIHPLCFTHFPAPKYPEIEIAVPWIPEWGRLSRLIEQFGPDHIHIAVEDLMGMAARSLCLRRGWRFSSSYHTRWDHYIPRLLRLPAGVARSFVRWFHKAASSTMVPTESIEKELIEQGLDPAKLKRWSRGIDLNLFYPRGKTSEHQRPIFLYVGRISKEKNLSAFLDLPLAGTKVLVGDGPAKRHLQARYPDAVFPGYKVGEELAKAYANADVFVFPSKTETFGNVAVEALASGVPVAAYPAPGPLDIITEPNIGALDENLQRAIDGALCGGDPEACRRHAERFSWEAATKQFFEGLVPRGG